MENPDCSVHAKMEEKISVSCNRDGGLESMEISGMLTLRISDDQLARVRLALHNPSKSSAQIKPVHCRIDVDRTTLILPPQATRRASSCRRIPTSTRSC